MSSEKLPAEWVAKVLSKLAIRYGSAFKARYAGLDEVMVAEDWAEQLAAFRSRPDCIAYALENLPPDSPPNAAQFRALCNSTPAERKVSKALPLARKPAPAHIKAKFDALIRSARISPQFHDTEGQGF